MATSQDYSFAGLENLWVKNGGDPKWAPTMAAVAFAGESGGNPSATNATSGAEGIWQVLSSAQSAAFNKAHPPENMSDPNANARAAIALLGNGSGISNWEADPIGAAIVANGSQPLSQTQAHQYATQGAPSVSSLPSNNPNANSSNGGVTTGPQAPRQPMAGVNLANFHGYDLTSIPKGQLGDVEYGIQTYITNPNQQISQPTYDAAGNPTGDLSSSISARLKSDYGYGSWAMNNKELAPVLIAAVVNGWDENTFTGAVTATNWYQTTNESQRDWQITQSTDPAKANAELDQARDKVLAVENQSGVQLSAAQVDTIAHTVASNSATQTGVLGSEAGFTQEQLEQAVVKAANLNTQTSQGSNTGTLGGIAGQLLDTYKKIAQQYLMYNPADPSQGLITDQSLVQQVQDAMQKYTGSGSFGSSNLIAGATADFTQLMQQQASQMYPSMKEAIAAGTPPSTYVQPLQSVIANTLGVNANSINFTDPNWNWAIATPDPKTGIKTALTPDQVLQKITQPNFSFKADNGQSMTYDQTNNAVQGAHSIISGLNSAFGFGG